MTVHALAARTAVPTSISIEDLRSQWQQFRESNPEVLVGQATPPTVVAGPSGTQDGPERVDFEARFDLDVGKGALLDAAEQYLQQRVDWYVLLYHGCTHDGQDRPCQPNETVITWGSPPPEVTP